MIAKIVGVTFENEEYGINRQDVISKLSGKEKIYLKRESNNRFDPNAVAVVLKREPGEKDFRLGYLRAELAAILSEMWGDYKFIARIKEIKMGDLEEEIPWGVRIEIGKYSRERLKALKKKKERNRHADL